MAKNYKIQKIKKIIWLKVSHGEDLLLVLSQFCVKKNIRFAFVSLVGALQKASLGYYQQGQKAYRKILIKEPTEITAGLGNVSLKEKKPFVHVHLNLADQKGNVLGGHLNEGTIVFACECALFELTGDPLKREFDETTGLALWQF